MCLITPTQLLVLRVLVASSEESVPDAGCLVLSVAMPSVAGGHVQVGMAVVVQEPRRRNLIITTNRRHRHCND